MSLSCCVCVPVFVYTLGGKPYPQRERPLLTHPNRKFRNISGQCVFAWAATRINKNRVICTQTVPLPPQDPFLMERVPETTVIPTSVSVIQVVESGSGKNCGCWWAKIMLLQLLTQIVCVDCLRQYKHPPLVFSQFHPARWIWDFMVIFALCWVTIFSPLQVRNESGFWLCLKCAADIALCLLADRIFF